MRTNKYTRNQPKQGFAGRVSKLLKTVSVGDIRVVDAERGKTQFMRIDAVNHQSGQSTQMVFENFKANAGVSDDDFSPASLSDEP
ncbi:MAG: outer membrane lipoprotein-sorting protein [Panacagrimonas sp.]